MSKPAQRRPVPRLLVVAGLLGLAIWWGPLPATADESAPGVELDLQSRLTASSPLAAGGAAVSQRASSADLSVPLAGSSAYGLGLDLIASRTDFRFANFRGFLPGRPAPISGISGVAAQPTLELTPTPRWTVVATSMVQYDYGGGADATYWSGGGWIAYKFAANLRLGAGFDLQQRPGAPPLFVPFPVIDWRISDDWSLISLDGETGRLSYAATPVVSLFGELEFLSQDHRLKRSASIPSGVMRYEAYPLSVGIEWKAGRHLKADLSAGEALAQRYRFEDSRGRLLRDSGTHAPLIGTLEIDCSF